ncbi:MAG: co-chaperone DjlA [Nitrosomonadaceae bacterium]|nr:co-chaperone DjlA [Nitrosomonadaceae bacterium]MDW7664637.1 co-chaperone DjlA [Nitrosomonadaceae bacterium]
MFKFLSALVGYYYFGISGAFIGYFLGSIIDRYSAYGFGGVNPLSGNYRKEIFLETVFILMGKLAKADGRISEDEVNHVEQFITKSRMSVEHRQKAITLFKQGSATEFDYESCLKKFIDVCGQTHNLKQMLLVYLIVMASSDGRVDSTEERLLADIALHLGYNQIAFKQLLDMVLNQSHFAGDQVVSATVLEDAYRAIGVSKDSSDQDIKRAYRKLMSQYHPDKLIGQGVPEDMITVATQQSQEVQVAYDLITKSRKSS